MQGLKALAQQPHPTRRYVALQYKIRFVDPLRRVNLPGGVQGTGATTMSLARPIHVLLICAAFLFIGAIVLGAI